MNETEILVLPHAQALAREGARRFQDLARQATAARGRFSVALSGGSTPGAVYRLLAGPPHRDEIPWHQVHVFWGDERCVPPGDPGSNYRLAAETFLGRVPLPPENVHRVPGELDPVAAARAYRRELEEFFCGPQARFDLVLLGLGRDGHTASLFPGSAALEEKEALVAAVEAHYEDRPSSRVTLTLPAINAARHVIFLVSGEAKAGIVGQVLAAPPAPLPARQVRPGAGTLTWLLDAAAAAQLHEGT